MAEKLPVGRKAWASMQEALYKKATGYTVELHETEESQKLGFTERNKEQHIPGDIKAVEKYLQLFGNDYNEDEDYDQ